MRPIPMKAIALLGLSLALTVGCGKKTPQAPQTSATATAAAATTSAATPEDAKTATSVEHTTTPTNAATNAAPDEAKTTTGAAAAPVAGPKHYLAWIAIKLDKPRSDGNRGAIHSALLSADSSGKVKVVARGEGAALMAHDSKVWAVRPVSLKKVKLKPCDTPDEVDVMGLERMPLDDPTGVARDVIYKDDLKAGDSTRYSDEVHLRAQVGDRIWVEHVLSEDSCPVSAGVIPHHTRKVVSLTSGIGAKWRWDDHVMDADRVAPTSKARAVAHCVREHPDAKAGICAKKMQPEHIWPGWGAKGEPTRLLIFHAQDEEFGSMVGEVGEVESEQSEAGGMQMLKEVAPMPIEIVAFWDEVNKRGASIGQGWSELSDAGAVKLAADWLAKHPAK